MDSSRREGLSEAKRALLEKRLKGNLASPIPQPQAIKKTEGPAPLSVAQEQMWLMDQFNPGNSSNNAPTAYRITGDFDVELFRKALKEIVKRQAIFRTTFKAIDGKPHQIVADELSVEIPVVDLQHLSESELETEIQLLLTNEGKQSFDLRKGPLVRVKLYQFNPNGYYLLFVTHHIISDGWSMGVFWREMASVYQSLKFNRPLTLPELPIQYADYSIRQAESLQGAHYQKQVAYWKNQLSGKLPILDWATDHPRPPLHKGEGSKIFVVFPSDLIRKLREMIRAEKVTLNMVLVSVLQTLIFRYTGDEDVMVGSPTAGRNSPDIVDLFGIFFNMLVFRTDLSGNLTFRELLSRVRNISLEAYDNQDVPFEAIVKEVKPQRDLSRNPLIQVYIQALRDFAPGFPDAEVSQVDFDSGTSQMDLAINVFESENGLKGYFEYDSDIFEASTIRRMAGHFQNILESVVRDPDQPISDLDMLSPDEKKQLLVEWNETSSNYNKSATVHSLFEKQAKERPQEIAIESGTDSITYYELNQKADQLAGYLRNMGVGPEVMVGFCMDRSVNMMVGLLAVLKAEGAYVPMDPSFPLDRLEYMIQDSGTLILLTEAQQLKLFPDFKGEIICIDRDWDKVSSTSEINKPVSTIDPMNLAYVIYTSGSTGKPKGVQICHRPVVNFLLSMQKEPGLVTDDVLVAVTTLSFDIAVLELFLPLITGAKLVIASKQEASDAGLLMNRIMQTKATVMQATPSTWRMLLDAGWENQFTLKMLCGGEALPRSLANQLLQHSDILWNMYGPTETTIWSAVSRITKEEGPVLIGPPIANTQLYILDKFMKPVPIGVPGELYIGGDGLARGYLNREELTNERFVDNPFARDSNSKIYKTGDLVRYRTSGHIEFLGRLDFQVKVRGFRIELGEIEQILNKHNDIKEAVVVVKEDKPGDKILVAYYTNADHKPSANELRKFLGEKLPEYMLPSLFVPVDEFPKTPNRKIDRKNLPAPDFSMTNGQKKSGKTNDELETQLIGIWKKNLGTDLIDPMDNFFEIGGHSLAAARITFQIKKKLGVDVPLETMFKAPTVKELAVELKELGWVAGPSEKKKFGLLNIFKWNSKS